MPLSLAFEDRHVVAHPLSGELDIRGFFAVIGGQGGDTAAERVKKNLWLTVVNELSKASNPFALSEDEVKAALKQAFVVVNGLLDVPDKSSCNINAVLIIQGKIYCANIGNCRSVLYTQDKAVPLSRDHVPTDTEEKKRVEAAGGSIEGLKSTRFLGGDGQRYPVFFLSAESSIWSIVA